MNKGAKKSFLLQEKGRLVEGMNTKDWLANISCSRNCLRPTLHSSKIHEDIFLWYLWNYPTGVLPNQPSENHKGQGKRKPLCQHSSALYSQNILPYKVFLETKCDRQNANLKRILSYFFYLKKTFRKEVRSRKSIKVLP